MSVLWSYFWPLLALGLVIGATAGTVGYRRKVRRLAVASGLFVAVALASGWHAYASGPLIASVDRVTSQALDYYEMPQIHAQLQRGPLTRDLLLSGQADDWQRGELARVLSQVPGVGTARWERNRLGVPLALEAIAAALIGFLLGLLLAYLAEWHRRHNAQWSW